MEERKENCRYATIGKEEGMSFEVSLRDKEKKWKINKPKVGEKKKKQL